MIEWRVIFAIVGLLGVFSVFVLLLESAPKEMTKRLLLKITSTKFIGFLVASVFFYIGKITPTQWLAILGGYMAINQYQKHTLKEKK